MGDGADFRHDLENVAADNLSTAQLYALLARGTKSPDSVSRQVEKLKQAGGAGAASVVQKHAD